MKSLSIFSITSFHLLREKFFRKIFNTFDSDSILQKVILFNRPLEKGALLVYIDLDLSHQIL